jgi:S1-C subfamily serine protease
MDRPASAPAVGTRDRAPAGVDEQPPPVRASRFRRPPGRRGRLAAGVVLACVLGGLVWWQSHDPGPAPITQADVDRAVKQGVAQAQQEQRGAAPDGAVAYRTVLPSLVTITTQLPGGSASELGAGVVVNASGAVLTALHVVADGSKPGARIEVRFADGTTATGTVTSGQADTDVAVLAVDRLPQVVVPAVLGGGVGIGDPVFPVGHPLGLVDSLSAGVVSAVDRSVRTDDGTTLAGLIQFDAAVNPGNSGGPLLNRAGQVVGIVTGLANPSAQKYFVGIGFAVPIATAGGAAGLPQR